MKTQHSHNAEADLQAASDFEFFFRFFVRARVNFRPIGKEDAHDLATDCTLRAWRSNFQNKSQRTTWLYRIARNRLIDFTRALARRPVIRTETDLNVCIV